MLTFIIVYLSCLLSYFVVAPHIFLQVGGIYFYIIFFYYFVYVLIPPSNKTNKLFC